MSDSLVFGVKCTCVALVCLWLAARKRKPLPYPPGPKGFPIIGNALDINLKTPQFTYAKWGKIFGDVVYFNVFGQDFVVVNSEEIARLLADKRSTIYSDRPHSPVYSLFGIDRMTPVMPYDNDWRLHRKLFHSSLKADAVERFHDVYLNNARQLLHNIQSGTSKFPEHFKLFSGSLALELTYGRKVEGKDDATIRLVGTIFDILSRGTTPESGGLLLAFPILEHFPSWLPGLGFKADAPRCRKMIATMSDLPFREAKTQLASGTLQHCLVSDFVKYEGGEESAARDAAAGVYLAAAESTASILETFVLAMMLHPEVQAKVHAELDDVLGKGVFPTFEDRTRLPYLQAVLYEVMRWNPVFPLGVPHATTTSDIYEGYHIPKGCIVIFNAWAMSRECPDPERFDPSRHLSPDGQLAPQANQQNALFFGFGRRICPGRFFADNALWAAVATMLSTLKFEKAKDVSGKVIQVEPTFTSGQVSHPVPFECSITSRV
ncbi:cytochrome P450 [Pisolithus croceorrhizus]|nr:cytochrome P450 [Pisolithus croceorrhizus]